MHSVRSEIFLKVCFQNVVLPVNAVYVALHHRPLDHFIKFYQTIRFLRAAEPTESKNAIFVAMLRHLSPPIGWIIGTGKSSASNPNFAGKVDTEDSKWRRNRELLRKS